MINSAVGMILAAGFGTRLKELTAWRPKPLMELGGRPIIFHQITMLEQAGVRDIFINVHHQAEQIIAEINKWPLSATIHFSKEEEILGTAGGIRRVLERFDIHDRAMIVLHGDMMCDIDLSSLMIPKNFCTLLCAKNRQLDGYQGMVSVDDHGQIIELGAYFSSTQPKVSSGFFTGIHYLSTEAQKLLRSTTASCLVSEVYPMWLKSGRIIKGDMRSITYEDLGTPERLLKSNLALCRAPHAYAHLDFCGNLKPYFDQKHILIGNHVEISPNATLLAPLIVGNHTTIDAHAIVGPNAIVGQNCHIKARSRFANSLAMSGTIIEKDEQLDCVIALSKARVLVKDKKDH